MAGVSVEIVEDSGGTSKLAAAVAALAGNVDRLAASADKTSGSTRKFGNDAKAAAADTTLLQRAVGGAQSGFGLLAGAIGSLGAYLGASKLLSYAETYTNISNKLKLVTKDQNATNKALDESFAIAQATRTGFEAVAGIYGKVSVAMKSIPGAGSNVAKIVTTISQALALSGTGADAAKNALTQFEQALSSGVLRGDEFNSVMENAPGLARALAEGLNVPIGRLRQMAEQGMLTGDVLVKALDKGGAKVAAAFALSAPTIAQAFTVIENAAIRYIGQQNTALNFTGMLANGMLKLANNMNIVGPVILTIVAGLALLAVSTAVSAIFSMAAGFVALAGSIGAAAFALATTFMLPLGVVAAAVAAAVFVLNKMGIGFKDIGTWVVSTFEKLTGYSNIVDTVKKYTEGLYGSTNTLNKSFGDLTGAGGKATQTIAAFGAAAQEAGKNVNSLGEDIDAAKKALVDSQEAWQRAHLQQTLYVQDSKDTGHYVTETGKTIKELSESMKANTAANIKMNDSVQQSTATNYESQGGYGAVVSGAQSATAAVDSYATAAERASNINPFGGSATSYSVNQQIGAYGGQKAEGGGQLDGDGNFLAQRNGKTLAAYVAKAEAGPMGFSFDPGNVNRYRADEANQIIALYDKYKPTATDDEVRAGISLANSMSPMVAHADPATGAQNLGNANYAVAQIERQLQGEAAAIAAAAAKVSTTSSTGAGSPVASTIGNPGAMYPGQLPAFATGGQFIVRGRPGTDTNVVPIRATAGERVTVETPAQQRTTDQGAADRGQRPISITIIAKDADSFARSKNQTMQDFATEVRRAIG